MIEQQKKSSPDKGSGDLVSRAQHGTPDIIHIPLASPMSCREKAVPTNIEEQGVRKESQSS